YQDAGGIRAASPGFKEIELKPDFSVDEMDNIDCSYHSIYGKITSNWKKERGKLYWHIEVPVNTTAKAYMADGTIRQLGSGIYDLTCQLPQPMPQVYSIPKQLPDNYVVTKVQDSPILCNEFLYKQAPFPECHSASIVECENGDLVATYFGGTKERNPDVCIWVSRKVKGSDVWTAPQLVADGVMNDTLRYACWNPVLFLIPEGQLMLYFKIGPNVAGWTGWYCSSDDNGQTWTQRQPLQTDYLGPVKNKPILNNGRIIAPTSIEKGGWRLYFENSDDMGKTWQKTDYVTAPIDASTEKDVQAIQPTILLLPDGRLEALCRTRSRQIGRTFSTDNGTTWSKLELTNVPNNNSGLDAVSLNLKGGGYALICNDWPIETTKQKGDRNPLSILISKDGLKWKHWITLEDSPISQYSYPSIIQSADGHLHVVYTWRRQRIKHVELLPPWR
ncbi:MAG: exo-alpha-sialidase, partial [Prevotellaceae bacterium]|nr:exo-alpha-sialidase [Prevotellaceae bacterium]